MYWILHLEGAPERVNHAAVAVDNKIYSFGGFCGTEGYEIAGNIDIWVLDTDTLKWSPVIYNSTDCVIPFKRYGHTVVSYGHKIYLWGGRNDYTSSALLHCFDVDTYTWTLPHTFGRHPPAADGHTACVIENYMYIFSGLEDASEKFGHSVHRLNFHTFEWDVIETYGTRPVSRDFHTASAIGHRMYIFGGRCFLSEEMQIQPTTEFYCNKIMFLDTKTMKWETPNTLGQAPCGRRSHTAAVYNNELYIIGGYNSVTQDHYNDIYKFDPVSNQWSFVHCKGKGPCPRRRHCSCLIGSHLYLFGGSSPCTDSKKDFDSNSEYEKLIDHSDLHILDFSPSLQTLCKLKVIECGFNIRALPKPLVREIRKMTSYTYRNEHFPRKDYGVFVFSA